MRTRFTQEVRGRLVKAFRAVTVAVLMVGIVGCGADEERSEQEQAMEEQEQATEAALAAADSVLAEARAASDTTASDTAGEWQRVDTDTAAGDSQGRGAFPANVTYKTYRNEEYNFSVSYPVGVLEPAGEIGSGNGRSFEAPGGEAEMVVYATEGADREKLRERYRKENQNPDLEVTYKTMGDDWYVVSGYRGNNIFYERAALSGSTLKTVRLLYDRSRKDYFNPITREISFSFEG